jgi:hypothetical protein
MERRRGQRSLSGVGDFGIQKSSRRPRSKRRRGVDKGGSRWRSCGGARGRLGSDAADAADPGSGRGRSVRIEPREGPMGSIVTGVASTGRARAETDLRRRVVGLCLACRVGGWGTGGRLSPASVRGPSGGRGRCGHVYSLRDGTGRRGQSAIRSAKRDDAVEGLSARRRGRHGHVARRGGGEETSLPSAAIDRARRDTGAGNSPDGRTCWDTHRVHPLTRTVESRDVRVGRGGAEARASSAFLFSASGFGFRWCPNPEPS